MDTNESVYNLIPEPYQPPRKEALYRSRFPGSVQTTKKPAASMGVPHTVVDSKQFLKRHTAMQESVNSPAAVGVQKRSTVKAKPSVPKRDEKPVMGLVSQKNYITANAVDNILAVPKKPVSNKVNYLAKQDYGQVPQYLGRVKTQIQEEYRMIEEMQHSNQPQEEDDIELITDDERNKLLEGLKANWEAVNKEYQTLSFTLDTPAKKKRKEEYEAQLEQIETDIKKLTKKFVFVHHSSW
mmetsp:Transcript_68645/g.143246  ORF Transcript_68645/g.143246 Transcript_68645/m.143246 type:complete len:239 (-) Transcript_68645:72-788(-)|eukprot:CAMPEP_0181316216 /NCGR_PEP_ID=MMETSP1101-20121128/15779_1 /TAXON_ID=46948 /ORGANISM="Rhodomonas abbreviata, Strain Caron Lab Isolate" /LENGTH=238 /DNA_ID=CAMNT_0023423453 /DNA_START=52 /DNA_END=768 /DNA_ORIENTATION=+